VITVWITLKRVRIDHSVNVLNAGEAIGLSEATPHHTILKIQSGDVWKAAAGRNGFSSAALLALFCRCRQTKSMTVTFLGRVMGLLEGSDESDRSKAKNSKAIQIAYICVPFRYWQKKKQKTAVFFVTDTTNYLGYCYQKHSSRQRFSAFLFGYKFSRSTQSSTRDGA
jgi:hypothetical protein